LEYLGIWESLYNLSFKPLEFEGFKKQAGLNAFTLSPQKWIENTNAIGLISKSGRYGGTFAHKDIAFKFASWISVEFELYFIKEFQRLKEEEQKLIGWTAKVVPHYNDSLSNYTWPILAIKHLFQNIDNVYKFMYYIGIGENNGSNKYQYSYGRNPKKAGGNFIWGVGFKYDYGFQYFCTASSASAENSL
jgi:hypothetical protein